MRDLISKKTLIKVIENIEARYGNDNSSLIEQGEVLDLIEEAPTIDAEPVRHGHWVHENAWYPPTCSMCGGSPKTPGFIGNVEFYEKYFHHCPNCGAKMDEVSEG